jgi:hypothetical protein
MMPDAGYWIWIMDNGYWIHDNVASMQDRRGGDTDSLGSKA